MLGWGLAHWLGIDLVERKNITVIAAIAGVAASAPLLLGLGWTLTTRSPSVRRLVELVENQLGPLLVSRGVIQLALLAIGAGAAEEVVFRGVLQVWLARSLPDGIALLLAAAFFGIAHWLTRAYVVLAAIGGVYLGLLFWATGNLIIPIVAHAAYDLVALSVLVRRYRAAHKASD